MTSFSPFTISPRDAGQLVRNQRHLADDNRQCYLLQITFQTVYGSSPLPQSAYKKLPRIINGIPFGPGRLSQSQAESIQWRYLEGCRDVQTFISAPISWDEADEARRSLRDRLVKQAKVIFGDVTVRSTIMLSQCIHFDSEMFINDIADTFDEGLHFND